MLEFKEEDEKPEEGKEELGDKKEEASTEPDDNALL